MMTSMILAPTRIQNPPYTISPATVTPSFSFCTKSGLHLPHTKASPNWISSSSKYTIPHSLQLFAVLDVRPSEGSSGNTCLESSSGMSKVIPKEAFGKPSEAVFEKARGVGFGRVLKGALGGGLGEALRGASGGASRMAPQALQVALGNCVNPHLEHFAP